MRRIVVTYLALVALLLSAWQAWPGGFPTLLGVGIPPVTASCSTSFDPANKGTDVTLSNGNRTATNSTGHGSWTTVLGTSSKTTGKFYVEYKLVTVNAQTSILMGFAQNNQNLNSFLTSTGDAGFTRAEQGSNNGGASGAVTYTNSFNTSYSGVANSVIQLALDFTAAKGWVGFNNTFTHIDDGFQPFSWTAGPAYFFAVSLFGSTTNALTVQACSSQQSFSPPSTYSAWN